MMLLTATAPTAAFAYSKFSFDAGKTETALAWLPTVLPTACIVATATMSTSNPEPSDHRATRRIAWRHWRRCLGCRCSAVVCSYEDRHSAAGSFRNRLAALEQENAEQLKAILSTVADGQLRLSPLRRNLCRWRRACAACRC